MLTVWIGAAGTATGYGVARSLRAHWGADVRVVTADVNPAHLVAASELADAHVVVPPVADRERFLDALGEDMDKGSTWVPLLAEEIVIAAEAGPQLGVQVLGPGPEAARLCADKLEVARWMEANGIPVPPTVGAPDARWWPEGVVVKPRTGQGSVGVRVVEAEAELAAVRELGEGAIAQRRCSPPEVTVDAFVSGSTFRAVCRERIEVKAGVCTKARLFEDPELLDIVSRIAHGLGLSGVLCVQAMRGPDGWEVTDLNPRPGAATPMSAAAGVDVTAAAFADLWGLPVEPYLGELRGEPFVVRHYEELLRYPG